MAKVVRVKEKNIKRKRMGEVHKEKREYEKGIKKIQRN